MRVYKKHIAGEMNSEGLQMCVICGEILTDYRGAMVPKGSAPLTGFPSGDIYVSKGSPTISQTSNPSPEYKVENCKP